MLLFDTIKRRYTPPTCTLEVTAKASPLSRWQRNPLVKNLQFELRFDDPRQLEDDPVSITGDRNQLDRLCDTVTTYIQTFLANKTPLPLFTPAEAPETSPNPQLSLQPRSLLTHDLLLGDLNTAQSVQQVSLNTTQLFDLATALERYSSEVDHLPKLSSPRQPTPLWAKTAALFILALGVTTAIMRVTQETQDTFTATSDVETNAPIIERSPVGVLPPPPPGDFSVPNPDFPDDLANRTPITPPNSVETPPLPDQSIPPSPANLPEAPRVSGSGNASQPSQPQSSPAPVSPPQNSAGSSPPPVASQPREPNTRDVLPAPATAPTVPSLPPVTSGSRRSTRQESAVRPPVAVAPPSARSEAEESLSRESRPSAP
ncbi:MAG: DUF4335 domain-containing protein, partial [Kamptonema sp. SIO4C4]|nr:DUF4335 domain-containing protein [Kamptonema sp. SIO4C4]